MKIPNKATIVFLTSILIFSCSDDDNSNNEAESRNWTATLEDECGEQSTQFSICVTEEEKDRAFDQTVIGEPCNWVSVKDIGDITYSGYWRSAATGNNSCGN